MRAIYYIPILLSAKPYILRSVSVTCQLAFRPPVGSCRKGQGKAALRENFYLIDLPHFLQERFLVFITNVSQRYLVRMLIEAN